jgi:pilus assembly protein CpaB
MNRRLSTILLLAFVVALISSYAVYRIAAAKMHPASLQPTVTKILVAARDIPIGAIVADADVTTGQWVGTQPKGAITAKENVVGRGVVSELYQGEPILDTRLATAGSGGGLAATIKPGMRACAVRVDEVVGVAGFVRPGMRVDVLVSGTAPGAPSADGPKVKTLLQNIEVLSAGSDIQKDAEGKPVQVSVVNLLVTPEQAELLSLASNQTRIQLVLRNPLDTDTPKTPSVAMSSVLSDGPPAPKPVPATVRRKAPAVIEKIQEKPAPARVLLVQVINGGKHTEEKFSESK